MPSKGRFRYAEQWNRFADYLKRFEERPKTFEAAYEIVSDKVSGFYREEAEALWNILQDEQPKTIVEIGRNLGGTLFLMGCAAQDSLNCVISCDIEYYDTTDDIFPKWFGHHGVDCYLYTIDSSEIEAPGKVFDFVLIDGLHTGEAVKADIEIWKDHARLIGFHDYSDKKVNKHKKHFPDVVYEISKAAREYGWQQVGKRGKSEIVFRTELY